MHPIAGSTALFVTNLLTCLILIWLRQSAGTPVQGSLILALGNLFLGFFAVLWLKNYWPKRKPGIKVLRYFALWSAGYVASYFIFLRYPTYVTLVQLIVARTIAPTLVVYMTGDWRAEGKPFLKSVKSILPLILLVLIGAKAFASQSADESISWMHYAVATAVFVGTYCSQLAARQISRVHTTPQTAMLASLPFCLGNGILMLFILFSGAIDISAVGQPDILIKSAAGGVAIGLTLGLFIYGLANTPPILSSLWISSIVPISIGVEAIFSNDRKLDLVVCILGVMYLGFIVAKTKSEILCLVRPVPNTLSG